MIQWKLSAFSIALGATATLGFVWLARTRPKRPRALESEDVARADALHDIANDGVEIELTSDIDDIEPGLDAQVESDIAVAPIEEEPIGDEHYDAIYPEDYGAEWLRRATEQGPATSPADVSEVRLGPMDDDSAEELPVGGTEREGGATHLNPPERPLNDPVELSPNDEDLERRAAAEREPASGAESVPPTPKPG